MDRIVQLAVPPQIEKWLASRGPSRVVLAQIVDTHLPELTRALLGLGFGGGCGPESTGSTSPTVRRGRRKPRRIDPGAWDALQHASISCGLSGHALLEVCLRRAYRDREEVLPEAGGD